ncbi:MAG: FHA domain-containing protein [Isosphaeraceae bacterium]
MSLKRLIYYSVVIGGWSAFVGWLLSEYFLQGSEALSDRMKVAMSCALVGGSIGAGLNLVAGMVNARWRQQSRRVVIGLLTGGVGGGIGGFLGQVLFETFNLPRAIGWTVMGAAIGTVEGLYDRSRAKLRNGLLGGALGGLAGGLLFDPIFNAFASNSGMSSRATAFVILGTFIGLLIGLIKVVLKDAWLTVLDGYRPGRQLILAEGETLIGRAEYAALPFSGRGDDALELVHAKIVRQADGGYAVIDNQSKQGTSVNRVRISGPTPLKDGDVLTIGSNTIQFSEKTRREGQSQPTPTIATPGRSTSQPPLPQSPAAGPRAVPPIPTSPPRPAPAAPRPAPVDPPRPTPAPASARPTTAPSPAPVVSAKPAATPAVAPAGGEPGKCPLCHRKVVKGQKFCIVHSE